LASAVLASAGLDSSFFSTELSGFEASTATWDSSSRIDGADLTSTVEGFSAAASLAAAACLL
jgi:hypothetical protein